MTELRGLEQRTRPTPQEFLASVQKPLTGHDTPSYLESVRADLEVLVDTLSLLQSKAALCNPSERTTHELKLLHAMAQDTLECVAGEILEGPGL